MGVVIGKTFAFSRPFIIFFSGKRLGSLERVPNVSLVNVLKGKKRSSFAKKKIQLCRCTHA